MKYFSLEINNKLDLVLSPEVAKIRFHQLSNELHPDKGGNDSTFQDLKEEYDAWCQISKHWSDIKEIFLPIFYNLLNKPAVIQYVQAPPKISLDINQGLNTILDIAKTGKSIVNELKNKSVPKKQLKVKSIKSKVKTQPLTPS